MALMLVMLMVTYNTTFAASTDETTTDWSSSWDDQNLDAVLQDALQDDSTSTGSEAPSDTWDAATTTDTATTDTTTGNTNTAGWGYQDSDLITATVTSDTVVLSSPILKDNNGTNIISYKVKYWTKSFAEPLDTSAAGTSDVKEYVANFQLSGTTLVPTDWATDYSGTDTSINITINGLTPWTTYYAVIYPQNGESVEWTPSKEVMFQTSAAQHDAAGANGADINAKADVEGTKVTVTWTPVEWAAKVQIQYPYDPEWKNTKKLADVPASEGKFTFDMGSGASDSIVKVFAMNSVGEQVGRDYQISLKPGQTTIKAPKVWPESTLLMWLLVLAILLYITYRVRKIEKA